MSEISKDGGSGVPDWALSDSLRRPALIGGITAGLFFGVFGGWLAFAPLGSAVVGAGTVVVADYRKPIQHLDGGIVALVPVREGQVVAEGDVLLRLDGSVLTGEMETVQRQVRTLRAQIARLEAERDDKPLTLNGSDLADDPLALQMALKDERRQGYESEVKALSQQRTQLEETIRGLQSQTEGVREQLRLIRDELEGTRQLYEKGLTPRTRLLALERAAADLTGRQGELVGQIASRRAALAETDSKRERLKRDRSSEIADGLRQAEGQLSPLLPRLGVLQAQIDRLEIRAPVAGRIVGQKITAAGAVLQGHETVMEVVPLDEPLLVEAKVPPDSIDELQVEMLAKVRLLPMKREGQPLVDGRVVHVSADQFVEERSGSAYFTIRVEVPKSVLAPWPNAKLYAGMPVEVVVPTQERSALTYMIEPLIRRFDKAFVEE